MIGSYAYYSSRTATNITYWMNQVNHLLNTVLVVSRTYWWLCHKIPREEFFLCVKLRNSLPAYQRIEEQASSSPKSIGSFFQVDVSRPPTQKQNLLSEVSHDAQPTSWDQNISCNGHLILKRGDDTTTKRSFLFRKQDFHYNKSYHICTAVNYFFTWMQNNKKGRTTLTNNTVERWNAEKRNEKEKEILLIYIE